VQDELPAANDTESEYTKDYQDPFNGQDPYDRVIKLLAAVCDSKLEHNDSIDGGPKEDTNFMSTPQPATAAMVSQESVAAIDGRPATLAVTALMKSAVDDPAILHRWQKWQMTNRNERSVISLARKTSIEYRTIGYNRVSRWCPNLK
jgi:hypothetical protein